jgi:hypothetical protein
MEKNNIVLFETEDKEITLSVPVEQETVWLNRSQMAELFDRDVKTIGKHINNALKEELDNQVVVAKFASTTQHGAIEGKTQTHMIDFYNLDVIISVGYRVKSKRGVEFRKWANSVLKQYILQGYAVNNNRITQLGEVIQIMKRTENSLDSKQVLTSDVDCVMEVKMCKLKEYDRFHTGVVSYRGDFTQDYDILYFCNGKFYDDDIMDDILKGVEIYRRADL